MAWSLLANRWWPLNVSRVEFFERFFFQRELLHLELSGGTFYLSGPIEAINETELPDYKAMILQLDTEVDRVATFYDEQFDKLFKQFYSLVMYALSLVRYRNLNTITT